MIMDDDEKKMTAYHEAGHAIVGRLAPETRSQFIRSVLYLEVEL